MTRTEQIRAVRRRGALDRDRGSRRVSFAIDAQRRLNTRPARDTRTKADAVGPSDPVRAPDAVLATKTTTPPKVAIQADITVDVFLFGGPRTDLARLSRAG
jgi:hypothetical protein